MREARPPAGIQTTGSYTNKNEKKEVAFFFLPLAEFCTKNTDFNFLIKCSMKIKFFFSVFQGQTFNFIISHAHCSPYTNIVDHRKTYLLGICVGSENVFKGLFTQDNSKEHSI